MDRPIKKTRHRFCLWPQWLAAAEVFLLATTTGLSMGWALTYLPKLFKPDSQLPISKDDVSWIVSIIWIAKPVGALLEIISTYYFGSKSSTLISGIPLALGWTCFFIENSVPSIMAFRILCGIGIGMKNSAFPQYIGEISDPNIRGALVCFAIQGVMAGNMIGVIMGAYLDMKMFAVICLVPNLLFLFTFGALPHTPHYLVRHNKKDEAAISIEWYNRHADVKNELDKLEQFIQDNSKLTFTNSLRDLKTNNNRKILTIINVIFGIAQFSGLYALVVYMEIILTKARVTVVPPATMVIIVSILGMICSWIVIFANDKFGRTIMLTVCSLLAATSMFLWGVNYQLLDLGFFNTNYQWISLIAACLFKVSIAGLIPIPAILISEIFAPNVKSLSAGITNLFAMVFAFIGSKSYQPMVDVLSEKYVFWIYALLMVLVAVLTLIFIPETKGKSLPEIQKMLNSRNKFHELNNKKYDKSESGKLLGIKKGASESIITIRKS